MPTDYLEVFRWATQPLSDAKPKMSFDDRKAKRSKAKAQRQARKK